MATKIPRIFGLSQVLSIFLSTVVFQHLILVYSCEMLMNFFNQQSWKYFRRKKFFQIFDKLFFFWNRSNLQAQAGTEDVHKVNWSFYELLMLVNCNVFSRSTKSNMTQNDLTSENDSQKSLYDTEDIATSKKARKKYDAFKNTQAGKWVNQRNSGHLKKSKQGKANLFLVVTKRTRILKRTCNF